MATQATDSSPSTSTALIQPPQERKSFNSLPPEVRLMIWDLALPGPRNIHIWQETSSTFHRMQATTHIVPKTNATHPTLLFVNRESRYYTLERYAVILGPYNFSVSLAFGFDKIYVMSPGPVPAPVKKGRWPVEMRDCKYAFYNLISEDLPKDLDVAFAGRSLELAASTHKKVRLYAIKLSLPKASDAATILSEQWDSPLFQTNKKRKWKKQGGQKIRWAGYDEIGKRSWLVKEELLDRGEEDGYCVVDEKEPEKVTEEED